MNRNTPATGYEDRVRERAYQLWIEEGQPEGRSDRHWDEARRLVETEQSGSVGLDAVDAVAADPAADAVASAQRGRP